MFTVILPERIKAYVVIFLSSTYCALEKLAPNPFWESCNTYYKLKHSRSYKNK